MLSSLNFRNSCYCSIPVLCFTCDVISCVFLSCRKQSFWMSPPSGTQEQENMPKSLKYVPYPCYVMCVLLHNSVLLMTKQTCWPSDGVSVLEFIVAFEYLCEFALQTAAFSDHARIIHFHSNHSQLIYRSLQKQSIKINHLSHKITFMYLEADAFIHQSDL